MQSSSIQHSRRPLATGSNAKNDRGRQTFERDRGPGPESIFEGGLIDLKVAVRVTAIPMPQISVTPINAVVVTSGDDEVERFDAETEVEANSLRIHWRRGP